VIKMTVEQKTAKEQADAEKRKQMNELKAHVILSAAKGLTDEDLETLQELINAAEGRAGPRATIRYFQSPENLETTSRLSNREIKALRLALWAYEQWPTIYQPLLDVVFHTLMLKISHQGKGRKEMLSALAAEAERRMKRSLIAHVSEAGEIIRSTSPAKKRSWWKFWERGE